MVLTGFIVSFSGHGLSRHAIYKVTDVLLLPLEPSSGANLLSQLNLKPCPKHHGGKRAFINDVTQFWRFTLTFSDIPPCVTSTTTVGTHSRADGTFFCTYKLS